MVGKPVAKNTAGTSASNIPNVVPAITIRGAP